MSKQKAKPTETTEDTPPPASPPELDPTKLFVDACTEPGCTWKVFARSKRAADDAMLDHIEKIHIAEAA